MGGQVEGQGEENVELITNLLHEKLDLTIPQYVGKNELNLIKRKEN